MRFCGGGIGHINQDCRWTIGEIDGDNAMEVESDELTGASVVQKGKALLTPNFLKE